MERMAGMGRTHRLMQFFGSGLDLRLAVCFILCFLIYAYYTIFFYIYQIYCLKIIINGLPVKMAA